MYNRAILDEIIALDIIRPRKMTFLFFARYAQPDGTGIFPGIDTASNELHCNEKTIRRDLKWLVDQEWLLPDGKVGYTNRYKINMDKLGIVWLGASTQKVHAQVHEEPPAPPAPAPQQNGKLSKEEISRLRGHIFQYEQEKSKKNPQADRYYRAAAEEARKILQEAGVHV